MIKVSDFDYYLPEKLIAQTPLSKRDESKLLVYNRKTDSVIHAVFKDLLSYLDENCVLVFNNTKVLPARIFGHRVNKEENVEFLLLKEIDNDIWECMVKPGKKVKVGSEFYFGDSLKASVVNITEDGLRHVKFLYEGIFLEILEKIGSMPLPPYIHEKLEDNDRYQTVYAEIPGSAAAPTAGLHFTVELLRKIKERGVITENITLNVGLGTFKPVSEEYIENHKMHQEFYEISEEVANRLNKYKAEGKKIIAVGTTTVRTLESASNSDNTISAKSENTDIFITPDYKFKFVDGLITNFHLPKSTLLMLISAFVSRERILEIYDIAVQNEYRFFSFGDAMLIL